MVMKKFWGDFHSNIHTRHMDNRMDWVNFAKQMVDFWAPVYYPFQILHNEKGFEYEGLMPESTYLEVWDIIKDMSKDDDFIMYPAYEWQGDGSDGDHNIFYLNFDEDILFPQTYSELASRLKGKKVIAIPHHTAYKPKHRGKNWATHNETLSPVAEIYSSHGSSEEGDADIPLNIRIHMGPRADAGAVFTALKNGIHLGIIASGDSHRYPTVSGNGFFAVYAPSYDRKAIFEAIQQRHTYGVTRSKIDLYYTLNDVLMGGETLVKEENHCYIKVTGTNAVKSIDIIRNGFYEHRINYYPIRKLPDSGIVKFKFELEVGWGPDRRVFPDLIEKKWTIAIDTQGKFIDYELLLTSPGCEIQQYEEKHVKATIISRKEDDGTGKLAQRNYLTPFIQNQSIIFEIEDDINHNLEFSIDELHYSIPIRKILSETLLEAKEEQVAKLLEERFDFTDYVREDPWWHNAYKFVIHRGCLAEGYSVEANYSFNALEKEEDNILVKVTQYNGDVAWSSPVYIKR